MKNYNDISDNEIRILGMDIQPNIQEEKCAEQENLENNKYKPHRRRWVMMIIFIVIITLLGIILYLCGILQGKESKALNVNNNAEKIVQSQVSIKENVSLKKAYTDICDTTINDIPLKIFYPGGGHIELLVGKMPSNDKNIILAAQAADVRADNGLPTGAFIYKGNLISKGHSKYGFCAIIGKDLTIGREIETPLYESAIENNGSFFRQYSIISSGKIMSVPPKGKSIRMALCLKDSKLFVVTTTDRESYHDFSQALVDYGVKEALSLVCSEGLVTCKLKDGSTYESGTRPAENMKYANYIVWRK